MTPTPLTGRRVLIVEDEFALALDLQLSLEESGAIVAGPVGSVRDALLTVASIEHLDAAVLDVNLHGEMVFPVADELERLGVPFVFATGYDSQTLPSRFSGRPTCLKPIGIERVKSAVELQLGARIRSRTPAPAPTDTRP